MELFFSKKRCDSCGGDNVVALYEDSKSEQTGNWYSGASGLLCMDCCWHREFPGRQAWGYYTGKNCVGYDIERDLWDTWDERARDIVRAMKNNDGLTNTSKSLSRLKPSQRKQPPRQAAPRYTPPTQTYIPQRDYAAEQREALRQQQLAAQRQQQLAAQREAQRQQQLAEQREAQRQQQLAAQQEAERQRQLAFHQGEYNRLFALGKSQVENKKPGDATRTFHDARSHKDTWELCYWLAHAYVRCPNKADLAQAAVNESTKYIAWCKQNHSNDGLLSCVLDRAEAYLLLGEKSKACDDLFYVGDHYYDARDFVTADHYYTRALTETRYFHGAHALFRIAYARGELKPPSDANREYQVTYYKRCIAEGHPDDRTAATWNLSLRYNELKQWDNLTALLAPYVKDFPQSVSQADREQLHLRLARGYQQAEQWEQGYHAFAVIRDTFPNSARDAWKSMGECMEKWKGLEATEEHYRKMYIESDAAHAVHALFLLYLSDLFNHNGQEYNGQEKLVPYAMDCLRLNCDSDLDFLVNAFTCVYPFLTPEQVSRISNTTPRLAPHIKTCQENEARQQAAQEAAQQEALRKAELERLRAAEEARKQAEEARRAAEEEARQKAAEEARLRAEEEARQKAEEEARLAAKRKADEELLLLIL